MEEKSKERRWYIIHTYSGYEKKVKTDLEKRIESLNLSDKVFGVVVPEEEVTQIKRGQKVKVMKKIFPGYVLIEMLAEREESKDGIGYRVDSEAWYIVRNTNGVTGFVGVGSEPLPMEEDEVESLFIRLGIIKKENKKENKKEIIDIDFAVGDKVKILEGSFSSNIGKVAHIDMEHQKVKIMIDIFGRLTPVELEFSDIEILE